jgi:hypothetical protein
LKLKLNAADSLGVEEMSDVGEDTLAIFTTGGKRYMMPNAWATDPGELGDAEISIAYNSGTSPRL